MLEKYFKITVKEIDKNTYPATLATLPRGRQLLYNVTASHDKNNVKYSYQDIFEWRHSYAQPGISAANVVALFYEINVENDVALDTTKLQQLMVQYFLMEFKDKNMLCLSYTKDDENDVDKFYILAYPLAKRTLDPRQWAYQGKMLTSKESNFFEFLQTEFGLKEKISDKDRFIMDADSNREIEDMTPLVYTTSLSASSTQTDKPYDDIMAIFETTYDYFVTTEKQIYKEARLNKMAPQEFLDKVMDYLDNTHNYLTQKDKDYIVAEMYNAVYDYYKLTPLINDKKISDIKCISENNIRVKVGGKRYTSNIKFESREDYCRFVEGIAFRNGIDLHETAMSHFVDKTGNENFLLRFNITTPYVASCPNPYLHIRKISKTKPTMNELIKDGMLTKELALWLIEQAKSAEGLIFVGRGGSGKTTLMNVLLEYIPYYRSVFCCQDNEELFSNNHPEIMFVHTVEAQGSSNQNFEHPVYDLKDTTKNALLVDTDYFIIGEIKGAEAMYFLNASFTGAKCWASLHSSVATLDKLADYVLYESKYTREQALSMLKNLKYVIHMDEYCVQDIASVGEWNPDINDLTYTTIYTHKDGFRKETKKEV